MKTKNSVIRWLTVGALSLLLVPCAYAQEDPEEPEEPEAAEAVGAPETPAYVVMDAPQPDGIKWQPPTPAIRDTAKKTDRLILIDFYADWCGYCRMQDATSYEDERVILITDQLVPTKVDGDINTQMTAQYSVSSYPTTLVLDADGREVDRKKGASQQADDYMRWLSTAVFKDTVPKLTELLKKQPDDIKLLTIMALLHSGADRKSEVPTLLNRAGDAAIAKFEAGQKIVPEESGQTARALRLLSTYFNSRQDYERAIPTLHYLAEISTRPREVVATHMTLADAFFQMNQTPKAIAQLEKLLKLEDVTAEEKQAAQAKMTEYKNVPA